MGDEGGGSVVVCAMNHLAAPPAQLHYSLQCFKHHRETETRTQRWQYWVCSHGIADKGWNPSLWVWREAPSIRITKNTSVNVANGPWRRRFLWYGLRGKEIWKERHENCSRKSHERGEFARHRSRKKYNIEPKLVSTSIGILSTL